MKVKICGITNIEDALLCESHGADALGFIFYRESKRYISPQSASEIISRLSPFTLKVGVFVNESIEIVNNITEKIKLNAVQLHGDESAEHAEELFAPVIKSFRINNGFDFTVLNEFKNVSYLLDTYSKAGYGGTGKIFNWDLIPEHLRTRVILAGGINLDNIEFIYKKINPAAVDLSSSLEVKPGIKDGEKVKIFFNKLSNIRS